MLAALSSRAFNSKLNALHQKFISKFVALALELYAVVLEGIWAH